MITTTSIPGARFVDPKVLARIGNLELVARSVVDGFINGLHRSPYFGASVDFAEHRGYVPGDDIRRVDWRLYARTDRYYIKEYEADSNSNFAVLLDVSRSMGFGSEGMTKLDYGRMLAGCLTYLVHKQRDRVGLVTFDEEIVDHVPPSAKHLDVVLHTLEPAPPNDIHVGEIDIFAGPNFVLSIRNHSNQSLLGVRQRSEREPELLQHGAGFVRTVFIVVVGALILKTGYDGFIRG